MKIHLINPSGVSFGIGVITPRSSHFRFSAAQDVRTVAGRDKTYPPWPILLFELLRPSGTIGRFE